MRLVWSREARECLISIEEFIARDSVERAVRFVDAIIDHAEAQLPGNPHSGRIVPEIGNPDIRELIYRGYRVVYRITGDDLVILSVFEGHRLLRLGQLDDNETEVTV